MPRPFIEIEAKVKKDKILYRFFGRGEWKVQVGEKWKPVNGVHIPAEVLRIAADHCNPTPPLTEIDIARLCGGSL